MTLTSQSLAAAAVPLSAFAGSRLGNFIGDLAAPDLSHLLGPGGALVGTLLAIRWLLTRLDKSEAKHEAREVERSRNFETLVTLTVQNQQVIEQNSETLREVKRAIEKP